MSPDDPRQNAALSALLDQNDVPPLPPGFADRVVALAEVRAPAPPRQRATAGANAWRRGQRLVLVAIGSGLLASAAAATGMLEQVGIHLPPVAEVIATFSGEPAPAPPAPATVASPRAPVATPGLAPARMDGSIDTREELETAFNRIDTNREDRVAYRRARTDERLASTLERRRAAGLPAPSVEREAALRERLAEERRRFDELAADQRSRNREALRERLDNGEALAPREVLRQGAGLPPRAEGEAALSPRQRIGNLRDRLAERRALAEPAAPQAPGDVAAPVPESAEE